MLDACRKGALFFHVHTGGEVAGAQAADGISGGAWEIRKTAGLPLACGSQSTKISQDATKYRLSLGVWTALNTPWFYIDSVR